MGGSLSNPGQFGGSGGQTPFGNAFNNMLNGQVNDLSGANQAITNSIGGGPSTQFQNFTNPYTSQTFSNPIIQQLSTSLLQGTGQADLSGIGRVDPSNINTMLGQGNLATSQFTNPLANLLAGGQTMMQNSVVPGITAGQASIGPGIALKDATQFDMNNPYFKAIEEVGRRSLADSVATERERWGASGAGTIGTGAQLAETNLQAAAAPQLTIALQQALQGLQQQDLAERGTAANVGLTSRGQDAQVGIANAGNTTQAAIAAANAALQGQGQNSNILSTLIQGALSGRGQDFQNQQTTNAQDIARTGLSLDQSMGNMNAGVTQRGQDLSSILQNMLQGNNFQIAGADINSRNTQTNNTNAINIADMLNSFNLTNQNQLAGFQQGTNTLNSQNYQANQNNWLDMLGMGQNLNTMGNQNQAQMIQLLMQAFGNSSQQGLPATTTYQQGSGAGSVLGAILPFLGQAAGNWWNNRGR